MNNEMIVKYLKVFIVIALVGSLVMNFILLSKFNQLTEVVQGISDNQSNNFSSVIGQYDHLQGSLHEMKEQQSWISRIDMDLDKKQVKYGNVEVVFKWQVKEIQNDSKVVFHYAFGDSDNYTEVPAEALQQGLYQVKIPVEVEVKPQWEIGMMDTGEGQSKEEAEQWMNAGKQKLTYFVSVSYGDLVKSGEVYTEDLGYIGSSYYGILTTDFYMYDEYFNVSLVNHELDPSSLMVEKAYLLKYENNTLKDEVEIKLDKENSPSEESVRIFNLSRVKQYDDMRLVLKVVYSNGETFEKEIYKK